MGKRNQENIDLLSKDLKKCSKCKEIKETKYFYTSTQKNDGYDSWCKKCKLLANQKYVKNPEVAAWKREYRRKYNFTKRQRNKINRMKRLYGVTYEEYLNLISKQKGKCAICREILNQDRFTHIDHCHKTDAVRGLLCHNCNQGLGHFKDNLQILSKAIRYLKKNGRGA